MLKKKIKKAELLFCFCTILLVAMLHVKHTKREQSLNNSLSPSLVTAIEKFYSNSEPYDTIREYINIALDKQNNDTSAGCSRLYPVDSIESLYRYLGHLAYRENKFGEACTHYHMAKYINSISGKPIRKQREMESTYCFYLGWLHDALFQYDSAEWYYRKELLDFEDIIYNKELWVSLFNDIGVIKLSIDDYYSSLLYFIKFLYESNRLRLDLPKSIIADLYTNIGNSLYEIGKYPEAKQIFEKSHELCQYSVESAICTYQNIALIEQKNNNYKKAIEYFLKAKSEHKNDSGVSSKEYIQLQLNFYNFLKNCDEFQSAHKIGDELSDFVSKGECNSLQTIQYYYLTADLNLKEGNSHLAEEYFKRTLIQNISPEEKPICSSIYIETNFILGQILLDKYEKSKNTNNLLSAQKYFQECIEYIEESSNAIRTDKSKLFYNAYFYKIYKSYLSLLFLELKEAEIRPPQKIYRDIIYISELCKYNTLSHYTKNQNTRISGKIIHEFLKHNLSSLLTDSRNIKYILEDKIDNLIESDSTIIMLPAKLNFSRLPVLSNEFILNFIISNSRIYCNCISCNIDTIIYISDIKTIQPLVSNVKNVIVKSSSNNSLLNNIKTLSEAFQSIFNLIDSNVEEITVIPEGIIQDIPFETLIHFKKDSSYLIEHYLVKYSFNLKELHKSSKGQKDPKDISITHLSPCSVPVKHKFGNFEPLKFSAFKSLDIEKTCRKNNIATNIREGQKATKPAFLKALSKDYYVHVSTHTSMNYESDPKEALIFNDNNNAEYCYLWDLDLKNTTAKHVILSACGSGKGRYYKCEGIDSFVRMLYLAGVNDIIYTNWNIPDKFSSLFFSIYYRFLFQGLSAPESLRLTKLFFIHNSKYKHPFFWSGINCI